MDEKELELNKQKKETNKVVRRLRSQISAGEAGIMPSASAATNDQRKRSYEDAGFRGVGSRIAEMEAMTGHRKRSRNNIQFE